jgi:transglutaminase-like putative cysteine protease
MIEGLHYPYARRHLTLIHLSKVFSQNSLEGNGCDDDCTIDNLGLEGHPPGGNDSQVGQSDVKWVCCIIRFLRYWSLCYTIGSNRGSIKSFSRRLFLLALLISALGCQPRVDPLIPSTTTPGALVTILDQREYVVHEQLTLVNEGSGQPEKQNIWIALIRNLPPYQGVPSMEISPKGYELVVDEYGNHYAEFNFSRQPAGTTQTVKIDYRVVVNELAYDLSVCQGELLDDFIQPELHIESANPQIVALASELSRGKSTVCQQVRAFYEYIGHTLVYHYNGANWGAQAALGPMGADCTEYTDLLVALSRAQHIPARYFEGLLYLDKGTSSLARIEHAWPDVYMPTAGWVAMDPTLGRLQANRDMYFAHYTPDHIIVTQGVNPSVLRGGDYWTHLYWPGNSTTIQVTGDWKIDFVDHAGQ